MPATWRAGDLQRFLYIWAEGQGRSCEGNSKPNTESEATNHLLPDQQFLLRQHSCGFAGARLALFPCIKVLFS